MREVIEVPILGADEEVGRAVAVPVDDGGRGVVPGEDARVEHPQVAEEEGLPPFPAVDLAEEVGVAAVDEQVEAAVAVPIGQAELPSTARAGASVVEPERGTLLLLRTRDVVGVEGR